MLPAAADAADRAEASLIPSAMRLLAMSDSEIGQNVTVTQCEAIVVSDGTS